MAAVGLKVVITGGASAGHVIPALAVAAELRRAADVDLVYFGRRQSIEEELATRAGLRFVGISAAGLRRYRSMRNLTMPISLVKGIFESWVRLRKERPDVVFAKGSYVAVPVGIGAWLARIPVVIHESDHSLGLANRILAPVARLLLLSVDPGEVTKRAGKTLVTGLPLRDDLSTGNAERLREKLGIGAEETIMLIYCGSQGAVRINEAIRSELPRLLERCTIVHVTGRGNVAENLVGVKRYHQFEYLHENMVDALWMADFVVGRAGATTLAELAALGKRTVVVPLPTRASRGDQLVNAERFARGDDRVVVLDDDDLRTNLVEACLKLAELPKETSLMPAPDAIRAAAHSVAERIVALAQRTA
ncbi:UDP-N-acetylglucosamine--N-acetylmuramyl-(pentapeptide) pyrophosphoryl-undecaprenol N-acetylglucosamine transferase [Nocardia gipuzkoensis]